MHELSIHSDTKISRHISMRMRVHVNLHQRAVGVLVNKPKKFDMRWLACGSC